jgi:hypothetical protein
MYRVYRYPELYIHIYHRSRGGPKGWLQVGIEWSILATERTYQGRKVPLNKSKWVIVCRMYMVGPDQIYKDAQGTPSAGLLCPRS